METVDYQGAGLTVRGERWVAEAPVGTVLLLHGGAQTRASWKQTASRLAGHGWTTIAMDARGHGDSEWAPDGDYQMPALVADLTKVCEQVTEVGDPPPVLVGASVGGITSLLLCAERPDLARALVLVDIAPRVEIEGANRVLDFMLAHLDGFERLEDVHSALRAYHPDRERPFDPEALQKNVRLREDGRWYWHWDPAFATGIQLIKGEMGHEMLLEAARTVSVPTLLVRGRQSDVLSEEGAREFLEIIPGARFADVSAGHMVAGDDNDVFTVELERFLAAL
jgi:pimeloyl-ACP methyl ester carboxylesterase